MKYIFICDEIINKIVKFPSTSNPQVPAFETTDGQFLTESNAIAYFVANEQLRGKTTIDQAHIQQWSQFAENEILPASSALVFPLLGILPYNKNSAERAKQDVANVLSQLNQHLSSRTFLVGERITLADIIVFANLTHLFQYVLDAEARKPYGNLQRWFVTILNQPQVQAVVKTSFTLNVTPLVFDPKKYAEFQAKTAGSVHQTAAAKPAAEKKEKKEKPKKEAAAAADDAEEPDAAELALLEEPKSKDPFDSMPKGTFNFDDFKRSYSNEAEAVSIPYFWSKFDAENYSIWYGEYKYAHELTKTFMSCNLIGGMFQRLDKMRKQSFASVCLFGGDNDSTISGIWVWRGQELVFPLSPDWQIDYEVYDWKKLDPASEETKALVKQYFSWEGTDKEGRKFNQGKIFK